MNACDATSRVDRSALSKSASAMVLCMSASARNAVSTFFMGWSLSVGLCENAHCTDLGQPAYTEVIAHG